MYTYICARNADVAAFFACFAPPPLITRVIEWMLCKFRAQLWVNAEGFDGRFRLLASDVDVIQMGVLQCAFLKGFLARISVHCKDWGLLMIKDGLFKHTASLLIIDGYKY
jgi:hypothetical protein